MTWARFNNTKTSIPQKNQGFTIVELLIVVVIIAILAAITIVAYNAVQARATFSRAQSDLKDITKVLELYKVDHGTYPPTDDRDGCTYDWCGWDQATGDTFIVGLSPTYISTTPQMPSSLPSGNTYLYQARGDHYQLIRYKSDNLNPIEIEGNPLRASPDYANTAWGYRTNTTWW